MIRIQKTAVVAVEAGAVKEVGQEEGHEDKEVNSVVVHRLLHSRFHPESSLQLLARHLSHGSFEAHRKVFVIYDQT